MTTGADARTARWRSATVVPLTVLAVLFAATFATQLGLRQEEVSAGALAVRVVAWTAFAVDYVVRARLSGHGVRFVLTRPVDLVVVAVPLLDPVLRLLALLVRGRSWLQGDDHVVRRTLVYLVSISATLVLFVAVAVLLAERGAEGATILSFGDALWWASVTVTTVGYGEMYPVTGAGRLAAVLGMLVGIGVLGTVTATISAQVMARVRDAAAVEVATAPGAPAAPAAADAPVAGPPRTDADLVLVLDELRALRAEVAALRGDGPAPPG